MAVEFLVPTTVGTHYEKGEVAGFDAEIEERLVDQKLAKPVKSTAKPDPKA